MLIIQEEQIEIVEVIIADIENEGCDNGNYPDMVIVYSFIDRKNLGVIETSTCKCGHGCSGTSRIPEIDSIFNNVLDLENYIYDLGIEPEDEDEYDAILKLKGMLE